MSHNYYTTQKSTCFRQVPVNISLLFCSLFILPCPVPSQILQQNLSCFFVLLTDESKPKKETAEGVFLIIHWLVLEGHTLGCPGLFCQLADEGDVDFVLLSILGCISSSVFPKNRKEIFPILGMGYSHISAGNIFI